MNYHYSIIVPYRDKYELFLKAIDSIPDRNDIQIIIVDNSVQPLPHEQIPYKLNANTKYVTSSPTAGAGCARNVGIRYVEGQYLLFLDSDDYFIKGAFASFDKYVSQNYDIVFFNADSVYLSDGSQSNRHSHIEACIKQYLNDGNEDVLRYGIVNPVAKLFSSDFITRNKIAFEETLVGNDVWFSIMSGYKAKFITADSIPVYMITEGQNGSSLTKIKDKDKWFTRYQVMIRVNKFLKSVDKYKYHTHLSGFIRVALKEYGLKESLRFLKYAIDNKVSIF